MTSPRPQLVAFDSMIVRLQSAFARPEMPSELEIKMLERDAKKLLQTAEPETGWIALTGVAAIRWQTEEALRLARDAVGQFGNDAFLASNLAVSFRQLNMLPEALDYARRAYEAEPLNWLSVEPYVSDLGNLGLFAAALEIVEVYLSRIGSAAEPSHRARQYRKLSEQSLRGMEHAGCTSEDVQQEILVATAVLREARIRYGRIEYQVEAHPEGDFTFVVQIFFTGSPEDEQRLGALLAPRLALLPNWSPSKLLLDFCSEPEDARRALFDADVAV